MQAEDFIGLPPTTEVRDVYLGEDDDDATKPAPPGIKPESHTKKPTIELIGGAEFHVGPGTSVTAHGIAVKKGSKLVVSQAANLIDKVA